MSGGKSGTTPEGRAHVIARLKGKPTRAAMQDYWRNNLGRSYQKDPEVIEAARRIASEKDAGHD